MNDRAREQVSEWVSERKERRMRGLHLTWKGDGDASQLEKRSYEAHTATNIGWVMTAVTISGCIAHADMQKYMAGISVKKSTQQLRVRDL